jgi:hypothetical protein
MMDFFQMDNLKAEVSFTKRALNFGYLVCSLRIDVSALLKRDREIFLKK